MSMVPIEYREKLAALVEGWLKRLDTGGGKAGLADVERHSTRILSDMLQEGEHWSLGNGFLSQQLSVWRRAVKDPKGVKKFLEAKTLTKIGRYEWGIRDGREALAKAREYLEGAKSEFSLSVDDDPSNPLISLIRTARPEHLPDAIAEAARILAEHQRKRMPAVTQSTVSLLLANHLGIEPPWTPAQVASRGSIPGIDTERLQAILNNAEPTDFEYEKIAQALGNFTSEQLKSFWPKSGASRGTPTEKSAPV